MDRLLFIDTDRMYDNLMGFKYGGLDNPDLYLDETNRRMCLSQRRLVAQLAIELYNEGKKDKALAIMESIDKGISDKLLPMDDAIYGSSADIAHIYYYLGNQEKARDILLKTTDNYLQLMKWYLSMNNRNLRRAKSEFSETASVQYSYVFPVLELCLDKAKYDALYAEWEGLCNEFERRVN